MSERSSFLLPIAAHSVKRDSKIFTALPTAPTDVLPFVTGAPAGWGLGHLAGPIAAVVHDLVGWAMAHSPSSVFTVGLLLDGSILHVEVANRGGLAPDPFVSRTDAELAVRLLTPPVLEWGAELDSRGRCLWATLRASQDDEALAEALVKS
jgi:hypothetical protein